MKALFPLALAALGALPAFAGDGLRVIDPFARVIGPSGAAYFRLVNPGPAEDVLQSVSSPDANMVMLMESRQEASGLMKMDMLPEGITVPAGGEVVLANGGLHVMLMSLTHPVKAGDRLSLTLDFKTAGQITVTLPVDNKRKTGPGTGPTPDDVAQP